jgi:PelA/Pel-15E family pectate lyase
MILRFILLGFLITPQLQAAVVGTNKPAESITAARIARLPVRERSAWSAYLLRSQRQMRADRAAFAAERTANVPEPALPKEGLSGQTMPLNNLAAWYGTDEARHIADVIVSFQTPAGGWSRDLDMSGSPRLKGQSYSADDPSKAAAGDDFDAPKDPHWSYVGTLDNDATNTEMRFLVLVANATPGPAGDAYRASFLQGVRYLLAAQLPNGGWPQVWPLEGGYHDAITYNDNAMTESAEGMSLVGEGEGEYAFVPADLRRQAAASADRALRCMLATQISVEGKRTVWAQQHDALTLAPVAGRNFEPAALASRESADILLYLMRQPQPTSAMVAAVNDGIAWLESAEVKNHAWISASDTPGGRHLEPMAGAAPIWARFYSIGTGQPIFGHSDKTIHDEVNELPLELRNAYQWYGSEPQQALDAYAEWSKSYAEAPAVR